MVFGWLETQIPFGNDKQKARTRVLPGRVALGLGLALIVGLAAGAGAQEEPQKRVPKVVPVPKIKLPPPSAPVRFPEPTDPPPQNFVDPVSHVYLHLGPGFRLERKDKELSTFHLDARTAPETARLRAVAMMEFNPFPASTFSGGMVSYSVTPGLTAAACEAQTRVKPEKALATMKVGGVPFWRGLDEHGGICTEARNVTYTAARKGSCVRFDLTVNTFCGGDVSGALDMTDQQLASVFRRLEMVLDTVEFRDGKNVAR